MRHQTFILITLFSINVFGQKDLFKADYINKKSKEWIHWYSSSHDSKGKFYYYSLISKSSNSDKKHIKISADKEDSFIDSIKKVGFINKVKWVDRVKKYYPSITLESIAFDKMKEQDSSFKFTYKITLTSIKNKSTQVIYDTRYGTEKGKVSEALKIKDYSFDIIEIKGTSIIRVGLMSEKLLFPDKEVKLNVFAPWTCYYF